MLYINIGSCDFGPSADHLHSRSTKTQTRSFALSVSLRRCALSNLDQRERQRRRALGLSPSSSRRRGDRPVEGQRQRRRGDLLPAVDRHLRSSDLHLLLRSSFGRRQQGVKARGFLNFYHHPPLINLCAYGSASSLPIAYRVCDPPFGGSKKSGSKGLP